MTLLAGCGSGPSGPKNAPTEPPPTRIAQVSVDAALPDAPPPPKLACEAGTSITPAPAPEPTWFCARGDGTRHGPFLTLFPDQTIEIAGGYRDGKLDGAWTRRDPNGTLVEEGTYASGLKTGHWKQSNRAGAVIGAYDLVDGTGIEKVWFDSGARYSERGVKAGVPHGATKIFAADGTLVVAARYANGLLDGPHAFGSRQGMRIEETFAQGVRRGTRTLWLMGVLIADESYDKRGRLDGAYTLWRRPRVPRVKGTYKAGKRIGTWAWFDRNNNKEREGSYVDGKRDGTWLEWWDGRLVFSGSYAKGKADGDFVYFDRLGRELGRSKLRAGTGMMTTFHPNKKPSSKQQLVKGEQSGVYQELTPLGKIVVEGHYRADQRHGTWKEWTPDGVLELEQTWKQGKLDGVVRKYIAGKIATEATYADGQPNGAYAELRDGKPALTGQFVDGVKDGTWTTYTSEGTVLATATYTRGVLEGTWRQLVAGAVLEGQLVAGRRTGTWTRTDRGGSAYRLTYTTP